MANHSSSHYPDIGQLGEDLVTEYLKSQGWIILQRRWRCPWGEIDIIAESGKILVFVEVKTRSSGSWDSGGKLAIATRKQAKLRQTAEIFLAENCEKSDYPCQFDVAIVHCRPSSRKNLKIQYIHTKLPTLLTEGYELVLQEYIAAAF
ncbi:YraN family protein [Calothrix sp. 336/3]|uniref:YraN family protein n=1 Tax=Calothrix sp. 336/3 TaxID=1337936 RepID=UPI0004E36312|nr:YraN family protein [Calothrix sp. 336/3]AKG21710.1 hypothetical protein IJ00_10975 [Calothrix sp. 336/3]